MNAPSHDHIAITATLQRYLDGARAGQSALMKPAFHTKASLHGQLGPRLLSGPIQMLFDSTDQGEPAAGLQATIAGIDISGTVANARLEIENWGGHRFTDMFTLLKGELGWQITSKVFHLHP